MGRIRPSGRVNLKSEIGRFLKSEIGRGNSKSHGARPVHQIITMAKWIQTSRLSIKNSLSLLRRMLSKHVPGMKNTDTPDVFKDHEDYFARPKESRQVRLKMAVYTLHPNLYTPHPIPYTLKPTPSTLNPQPSTLNPQPSTLNPQPSGG